MKIKVKPNYNNHLWDPKIEAVVDLLSEVTFMSISFLAESFTLNKDIRKKFMTYTEIKHNLQDKQILIY